MSPDTAATSDGLTYQARQVSGKDPAGQYILSVIAKRSYVWSGDRWLVAPEQAPLIEEPIVDDEVDLLTDDTDLYPFKPLADLVVKGHAYSWGRPQFEAFVRLERHTKQIMVFGDRRVGLSTTGHPVFSAPEPVERVPLTYTHAYGGFDSVSHARIESDFERQLRSSMPGDEYAAEKTSPCTYPRNPCGRGYLVELSAESVEAALLPNLEDPYDPLRPDRLAAGDPLRWVGMPMPQATDWVHYAWFPRLAYLGLAPPYDPALSVPEIERGFAPKTVLDPRFGEVDDAFRLSNGASLGLQVPYPRGGEVLQLENMHVKYPSWRVALPVDRPRLWTDGRKGKLNETEPVIQTVVINPDDETLTVVWRGSAPALRPYLTDELEEMPFRVEWG